jgi:hypothetical protein
VLFYFFSSALNQLCVPTALTTYIYDLYHLNIIKQLLSIKPQKWVQKNESTFAFTFKSFLIFHMCDEEETSSAED